LSEIWPGYERVVLRIFGDVLTLEEREMVAFMRHICDGKVPQLDYRLERAIKGALKPRD
jgi:hypothetical protein